MPRPIDMLGRRYGRLIVVAQAATRRSPSGQTQITWACRCDCGVLTEVRGTSLRRGLQVSCGCYRNTKSVGSHDADMPGSRFGRWLVGERVGTDKHGVVLFRCTCDCGLVANVRGSILRRGRSTGCRACVAVPAASLAKTKEVVGYMGMHDRLRKHRGRVQDLPCVDCGGPAADWSYDGGDPEELRELVHGKWDLAYSLDPNRYSPRCRRDHRLHDNAMRKASA